MNTVTGLFLLIFLHLVRCTGVLRIPGTDTLQGAESFNKELSHK